MVKTLVANTVGPGFESSRKQRLIFVFINFNTFSFKLVLQNNFSHSTLFVEKYFQGVLILASVLFVLYREALVVEWLRRLPRMQEVVGSNPTEGKIRFSQFTLFNRVECEKLFCKTNLKLKVLKLIKTKFNAKP